MNDFGRKVDISHRFDDFVKLHDSLLVASGMSLPSLPVKQLFGGNDPKVVEERRPVLELLLKECVSNEKLLAEEALYKFLGISSAGSIVIKFLLPSTRLEFLPRLSELLKPEMHADQYRLFSDSVIRTLLYLLKADIGDAMIVLEVLQFILSRHEDSQKKFVDLHGIPIVWNCLVTRPELGEHCRKVLSVLITCNLENMEKFEILIFDFLNNQNGIIQLLTTISSNELLSEIASKLIWFGLSLDLQQCLASHPKGLALLGSLFSCPNSNAQCLAGLTLSVLVSAGVLDQGKEQRAKDGISQILTKFTASSTDLPTKQFLSTLCRGSGLKRILSCLSVNALPAWVIAHADLSLEFIESSEGLTTQFEDTILTSNDSITMQSCGLFLFRLYSEFGLFPQPRKESREVTMLMRKVQESVSQHTEEGRKMIRSEYSQFKEFGSNLVEIEKIFKKKEKIDIIGKLNFNDFEIVVQQYEGNCDKLHMEVDANRSLVDQLGAQVGNVDNGGVWLEPNSELVKEWNLSAFALNTIKNRLFELESKFSDSEKISKSAESDSINLQSVISKMREEIVQVDEKAESFRTESSRFVAASSVAVDGALMLQRAAEAEAAAKEQITIRETLRQSQDSLESQLAEYRGEIVRENSQGSLLRKAVSETKETLATAEKHHEGIETRLKEEMGRIVSNWTSKMARNKCSLLMISEIFSNFNMISKLIESENEGKDMVIQIIGELVLKLQTFALALE